jgi:hypothetical protein
MGVSILLLLSGNYSSFGEINVPYMEENVFVYHPYYNNGKNNSTG